MASRLFSYRPIIAAVLALGIVLGAGVALCTLPVIRYPEVVPPTVVVDASYPGANAQTVTDTVAAPIEEQVYGVEGMVSMTSQCTEGGNCKLIIIFRRGTNLDIAQVLVQNRLALALPTLPALVQREGIIVKKMSPKVLMLVKLYSSDGKRDVVFLSNYATIYVRDELSRLPGVGDVTCIGRRGGILLMWLDPEKLSSHGLSARDVVTAVRESTLVVPEGGVPPPPAGAVPKYVIYNGYRASPEQFEAIILRTAGDKLVYLKDVARIELGPLDKQTCTVDGKPAVGLEVYPLPGSNRRDVVERVKKCMEQLKDRFPDGIDYVVVHDTPPFNWGPVWTGVRAAIVLVAVVLLVFLQRWRSTLTPRPQTDPRGLAG